MSIKQISPEGYYNGQTAPATTSKPAPIARPLYNNNNNSILHGNHLLALFALFALLAIIVLVVVVLVLREKK